MDSQKRLCPAGYWKVSVYREVNIVGGEERDGREPITAYGPLPIFESIPGSQANKAAIKAMLVNRVGSLVLALRNKLFFMIQLPLSLKSQE